MRQASMRNEVDLSRLFPVRGRALTCTQAQRVSHQLLGSQFHGQRVGIGFGCGSSAKNQCRNGHDQAERCCTAPPPRAPAAPGCPADSTAPIASQNFDHANHRAQQPSRAAEAMVAKAVVFLSRCATRVRPAPSMAERSSASLLLGWVCRCATGASTSPKAEFAPAGSPFSLLGQALGTVSASSSNWGAMRGSYAGRQTLTTSARARMEQANQGPNGPTCVCMIVKQFSPPVRSGQPAIMA